jgi:uncharacterized membrane protein
MDVFLGEWANLLIRWAHMIVGIGWIGTSFYFVALDFCLKKSDGLPQGVSGEDPAFGEQAAPGERGGPEGRGPQTIHA